MDDRRFDSFTRSIAAGISRRRIVAGAIASASSLLPTMTRRNAEVAAASRYDCEECRTNCRQGYVCLRDNSCFCCSTFAESGSNGATFILTNEEGEIVSASAPGAPGSLGIELTVDRGCAQDVCTSTMAVQEIGASDPTIVSTIESSSEVISLRLVGSGVDYTFSVDPNISTIESTSLDRPPITGTFDPATGKINADFNCDTAPFPFADTLAPLESAFSTIAGGPRIESANRMCPPEEAATGDPSEEGTGNREDDPAAINWCEWRCEAAWLAIGTACCGITGPGCILCAGGAALGARDCYDRCAQAARHGGGGAPRADIGNDKGVGLVTPTPSVVEAEASDRPSQESETEGSNSQADCPTGERRCGGRCIPFTECPENCCFDPGSCGCICPDCLPNFVADLETCTCVCSPSPCAPGSNWQFDQESCSCVCIPPAECPPNFVFNEESCSCVCGMTECSPNHVWDLEACTCTCVAQECPANQVFDESLCGCVCGLDGCPPNYVFDEANCACICTTECPPTFRFDEATCSCVCELTGCPPNLTFDPGSCACFCAPPVCPPGFVVDQASCACFCLETNCAEGQVFDPASCGCLQSGAGAAVEESG